MTGDGVALLRIADEARERRPGDDDLVARLENGLADVADHGVGARRHDAPAPAGTPCRAASAADELERAAARVAVQRPARPPRSPASADGNGPLSPSLSPSEATPGGERRDRVARGKLLERRPDEPGAVAHVATGSDAGARAPAPGRARPGSAGGTGGDRLPVAPVVAPALLPAPPEEAAAGDEPEQRGASGAGCRLRGRRANDSPSPATKPATAAVPRLRISRLRYHQPIDIAMALRRELSEPNISGASGVGGWPGRGRRALLP